MVSCFPIKCTSCSQNIKVYFSFAGYFPQETSFTCKSCSENITVGYDQNRNLFLKGAELTKDEKGAIDITVSPDKPLDVYSDLPAPMQTTMLAVKMGLPKMNLFEIYEQDLIKSKQKWIDNKTFFRILKDKSLNEAEKICNKTKESFLSELNDCSSFYLSGEWNELFTDFSNLFTKYKNDVRFTDIKQDIRSQSEDWLEKMYNAYDSYFEHEHEFKKITLMQKCNQSNYPSKISCHWNDIKKIYADIYEATCSMFIIPTAISNLENSRNWNTFQEPTFTWEKYLETDMDGRGKNFESNPKLKNLLLGHDNRLRNAPSHAASKFNCIKSEIIMKCGKGGKKTEIISLAEYMKKTNELFAVFLNLSTKFIEIILN